MPATASTRRRSRGLRDCYAKSRLLAEPPRVGVWLREVGDTEGAEDDFDVARWDVLPDDMLHIVEAVEGFRRTHVPVPLLAVGSTHDEVEIVLKKRALGICPNQGHFES